MYVSQVADANRAQQGGPAGTTTATAYGWQTVTPTHVIDVYTVGSATTYNWNKTPGAKMVDVYICAAGAGGASGAKGTGITVGLSGGGGGAGGAPQHYQFTGSQLPSVCTILIPIGGNGGASVTATSSPGNAGSTGSAATFTYGSLSVRSNSVGAANAGTWSGTIGVSGTGNSAVSSHGSQLSPGAIYSSGGNVHGNQAAVSMTVDRTNEVVSGIILPGLAGGSIAFGATPTAKNPSINGAAHLGSATLIHTPAAGGNGIGSLIGTMFYALGGAGGAASTTADAQKGGDGIYGSGGGGGGAALDGVGNSGAGGKGGDAWCVVVTTL
jgi:hypothetical protein